MEADFEKTELRKKWRLEVGFEKFTQDSREYASDGMISLNNRFPNLVGFGVVQYLKQLMAQEASGRLVWEDDAVIGYSNLMRIDKELLEEIVNYCVKSARMMKFQTIHKGYFPKQIKVKTLMYPAFMTDLMDLQIKRKMEDALFYHQLDQRPKFLSNTESLKEKRDRMVKDLNEILVLSEEQKKEIRDNMANFYVGFKFEDTWEQFCDKCRTKYLEWHGVLSEENKVSSFYVFLNNLVIPKIKN